MEDKKLFKISTKIASVILNINSLKDKKAIDKWLKESPKNQNLYSRLSNSDSRLEH